MRAWQFVEEGQPLTLREVAEPGLASDGVIVDVKAAGICHTDTGFVDGTLSFALGPAPITLGHEIAGVVSAVGADVTSFAVGDRVAIPANAEGAGTAFDGGFAAKVASPADWVVPLPEGIDWGQAAAATDAGLTSFHATVAQGRVIEGTKVGVIGFGGLGSVGAQIAVALGAEVYVAEKNSKAQEFARSLGFDHVSDDIAEFVDCELDVVIDYAGFGTTTAGAIAAVRTGGRVVLVGMGVAEGTIPLVQLVVKEVHLIGSLAGSVEDCEAVLKLVAAGTVSSRLTPVTFDEIGEGLERLRRGEVVGRLVAMLD
jgi:2-desacetyl-2-hydroxyethyl bacteriochlorophyllide A dehydrogenase